MQRRAATLIPALLLALAACPRPPRHGDELRATCASLDAGACERARALLAAASTYADEEHDYVLEARALVSGAGLERSAAGWRPTTATCATRGAAAAKLDATTIDYAFVGVAIDATLVSADADLSPLLGAPGAHDVRLVAVAFARDLAPPAFDSGASLVAHDARGACVCGAATHFAGAVKYGGMLAFDLGERARDAAHVRATDYVRAALSDPRAPAVRETRVGGLQIDGLAPFLAGVATRPLAFRIEEPRPIAYAATPIDDVCPAGFLAPEVSPSPLDFGVAPYGTEATRRVHVVNRASIDLQAVIGASTYPLSARGTLDLPLRWTPQGDALACETQTRDESILFVPARPDARDGGAPSARTTRVLETIRTGRPRVVRADHVEAAPAPNRRRVDYGTTTRDLACPADFARTACRVEHAACPDGHACTTGGYAIVAEARGPDGCHFACRGPEVGAPPPFCRFDAVVECALSCP